MTARRPRLWVIDPSVGHPEQQGVEQILEGWPGESRVFRPALGDDGPSDRTGYDADGFVVMGSRASVHDRLPWMERLSSWLGPILGGEKSAPLLGICFGHQLIAHLAGAEVGFLSHGTDKRLGIETSRLLGGRLLPDDEELRVVVSHREHVASTPSGYRRTATRPGCAIDGLEHDRLPIYAFQFHPEAREEFMRGAGIDERLLDDRVVADSRRLLAAFRATVLDFVDRPE